MSVWSEEYGLMVCSRCRMPRDQSDHVDIYDCLLALGEEVSRLQANEHKRCLVSLDNPPMVKR